MSRRRHSPYEPQKRLLRWSETEAARREREERRKNEIALLSLPLDGPSLDRLRRRKRHGDPAGDRSLVLELS